MMVTTLHKLIGLSVAMLGQAPGTDLLNQWTRLYTQSREDGMDAMAALQQVAQHILDSAAFAEVHPAYTIIENQEFAQQFLDSVLGETASAEVVDLVVELLDGGTSRAEVAVRAVEYLLEVSHQGSDHVDYATFGSYATRFGNQMEVARYYTVDKVWMTPNESVLGGVDDTPASVTAAKSDIDGMQQPGKNFVLTPSVDQFTGTPGNDTFVATESTLSGADRLHGKGGKDTLELSSGSGANENISIPRGAMVDDIETLSVTSDGDFSGDVSQWTGLETVQLEVVKDVDLELKAGGGTEVTSTALGDDDNDKGSTVTIENAGMVKLEGVNHNATVKITGEGTESVMVKGGKGVDVNSAASPSLTLKSVTLDGVHNGMGKDGKRYGAGENKDSVPVHIYSKAIEDITVRNTNTTLLVQNDDKDMTRLTAMVDQFGMYATAAEHGKLCLKGIEDLMLKVAGDSNIRLASDQIKQVEVSGAGDLRLNVTKFAPAVAEKAADLKASTTLESLMLSGSGKFTLDAKGLSKLMTVDAGAATGAVSITNLGNSVTEYTGSAGKDTVTVAAFNSKGLMANLGAGDDRFTVDNAAAGSKSEIDGGDGMDTLVLMQKVGANLTGAGDAYTGFETITLEAGGGSGTYDVKGLEIDNLNITGGTANGGADKVTFKNLLAGMPLNIISKMPDSTSNKSVATTSTVSYMLADGELARSFGGDNNRSGMFTLHLHTRGGKADEKTDLGFSNSNRKTTVNLTLDSDIKTLVVHSTASVSSTVAAAKRPQVGDYVNQVVLDMAGDQIANLKVTGDAGVVIRGNRKGGQTEPFGGPASLEYVDATENTGGVYLVQSRTATALEFHGGSGNDVVVSGFNTNSFTNNPTGAADKLIGNGGDDVLVGSFGANTFTGGAGGDVLIGNPVYTDGKSSLTVQQYFNSNNDTFVYKAASDSRVDLDTMTGFDIIHRFVGNYSFGGTNAKHKLQLSSVAGLELQGTLKDGNNGMDGASGGGDDFANTGSLKDFLTTHHKGGADVFETSNASELGNTRHSIVKVVTKEDTAPFERFVTFNNQNHAAAFSSAGNYSRYGVTDGGKKVKVTWILVDVDADGSFDADTDMAIALVGVASGTGTGPITTDNFS